MCAGDGCGKSGDLVITLRDGGAVISDALPGQVLSLGTPVSRVVGAIPFGSWALDVYLDVNANSVADVGDVVSGAPIAPVMISSSPSAATVTLDQLLAGCTATHDCALAQQCDAGRCVADPGGIGTACPAGTGCAMDGRTTCLGPFVNGGRVCTRVCQSSGECPLPFTCQGVAVPASDGGVMAVDVCLAPDALGVPCRNLLDNCNPATDTNFCVDPTLECTVSGEFCMPSASASKTGHCVSGDGCDFAAQSGCPAMQTCHPAGLFNFDDTLATLCLPSGSGQQRAACTRNSDCAHGLVCAAGAGCLAYCTVGASVQCQGVVRPDGGAASCLDLLVSSLGQPLPAPVRSIAAGVCF